MPFTSGDTNLFQLSQEQFDFNVQFEQLFFSIVPSALFIITSSWRALSQARKPIVVNAPFFRLIKVGTIVIYLALELTLLILGAIGAFQTTNLFVAASVLKLVSAIFMIMLSVLDHSRSPRPSITLSIYLFLTLLLDAAQARTLFLSSNAVSERVYSVVFTTAVAIKATILILEAKQKSSSLYWDKKEHSPEETSSIFSIGVFYWLNRMFRMGYRKILTIDDLYPLDIALDAKSLHDDFAKRVDYSKFKGDKFGLAKVLVRTMRLPLLLPVLPRLMMLGFTFCQPLFMEKLLDYLSTTELDPNTGYGFIGASFFIYSGIAISMAFYWYLHNRARTMARSILVTEVYRKATEARIEIGDDSAALTLMSTDMERIRVGFRSLHETWASVVQASLAAWMLYIRLGVVFVAPIGLVILCFTLLAILLNFTGDSQRAWMSGVQKRVGLTATVIASMKNLKISGLTAAVGDFIQQLRVQELAAGARFRKIWIAAAILGYIPQLLGPPITFALAQRELDASTLFTSLAFLSLMTYPLSQVFEAVPQIVSGLVCLGRIQAFLECDSRHDYLQVIDELRHDSEKSPLNTSSTTGAELLIQNGSFGWYADRFVLRNIDTQIPKSSLTVVVGPVGAGKSTFCRALLSEIPFSKGRVVSNTVLTHVGFCDQTAFLFNGSIRDNIVGFAPFNGERYAEVIHATALEPDLVLLPQRDRTNIGSDGIILSGGQKQRVSLARALYLHSNLLVLDDVFSGLDASTEEQVFQRVFGPVGLLQRRHSTVVLCTHSIKHLRSANHIIVLGGNTITEQGSFQQLMASQGYVHRLGLSNHSDNEVSSQNSKPEENLQDSKCEFVHSKMNGLKSEPEVDKARQVGDSSVYKHYVQSMGWFLAVLGLFFGALWGFFTNFPTIWLTYWTDDIYSDNPRHSYSYYAGIYALLQLCALISLLLLGTTLWVVAVKRAGANLHLEALQTLVRAPLYFFTKTDTGIITNLFSQDLNLIDTELPDATLSTLFCVFQAIGQAAVMLTSSAYLAIAYPLLGIVLYFLARFYLRTSRQLRLLDLEAKSPLYTHFLDTLKGITTLRAFGFLASDIEKNTRLINTSQRPAYFLLMIQEWLNLVLNLVVMILAVVLVTLSVRLHSASAFAGAALYSLITLGENLAGIVLYYTRLETSIGAIARLKSFSETVEPEDKEEEDVIPPENWPHTGVVALNGVSASYETDDLNASNTKLAICDIHLEINSGEKIAICGRTGSGKSSLVALLLKLFDPTSETADNVCIDGVPLRRINRSALRQRIIAVPQEAVFLPDGSTFQSNLDPLNISTTQECESVLDAVGLWQFVLDRGGLKASMSVGTLSAGQRQVMSVGRALLRRHMRRRTLELPLQDLGRGILLLDEVSSSVDHETERVIQTIIRTEFRSYTVIAVSHRLDMIMDFDKVIVMDSGKMVEVGNPTTLAREPNTKFGDLVRAAAKEKAP